MIMTAPLYYYIMVFVGLMGLCIGSFLNVVIYRVPEGLSIASPGSRCGSCGHPIRFYDNIPVLSWFILGGKCRDCHSKISFRYPAIEALTGILAIFIWWQIPYLLGHLQLGPERFTLTTFAIIFLLRFIFVTLLIIIAFIDLDHFIIPHRFTIAGMIFGLASPWSLQWLLGPKSYLAFWPPMMPVMSLVSLLVGGIFIIVIFYAYLAIRGVVGLGGGDAMLMAMVGAWLGIPGIIFVCFAASFQGLIVAGITSLFGINFIKDSRELLSEDSLEDEKKLEENEEKPDIVKDDSEDIIEDEKQRGLIKAPVSYAAIPFGPFIALSAVEFMLFGVWFPEYLSMVRAYYIFL